MIEQPMERTRGVGICTPWHVGHDVLGMLLVAGEDGRYRAAASHVSSSPGFARHDIGRHADRLGIEMEWVGELAMEDAHRLYPPADDADEPGAPS